MNLVLDASVVVTWFVGEDGHAAAHRPFAIDVWSAPSLIPIEVASTLRKKVRRGAFAPAAVTEAVGRLARRAIRDVVALVVAAACALATRLAHPVDDGRELVVAAAEGGRVVSADRRRLARVHGPSLAPRVVALDALAARG